MIKLKAVYSLTARLSLHRVSWFTAKTHCVVVVLHRYIKSKWSRMCAQCWTWCQHTHSCTQNGRNKFIRCQHLILPASAVLGSCSSSWSSRAIRVLETNVVSAKAWTCSSRIATSIDFFDMAENPNFVFQICSCVGTHQMNRHKLWSEKLRQHVCSETWMNMSFISVRPRAGIVQLFVCKTWYVCLQSQLRVACREDTCGFNQSVATSTCS